MLDFFAFKADVGNPMLAAAIRAAGHVQLQLLIELRNPFLDLFDQPARKALRLRNSKLAELRAGAGNRAAPEGRALHAEASFFDFAGQFSSIFCRYVDEDQVL